MVVLRKVVLLVALGSLVPVVPLLATLAGAASTCFGKAVTITAVAGEPTEGTEGNDVIMGTRGADEIDGLGGNDRICSSGGADAVRGGAGRDRIKGGGGDDSIDGGEGPDRCLLGRGSGTLTGCERPVLDIDVRIQFFSFFAEDVPAGSQIVVVNKDTTAHTWTSEDEGLFDSGPLSPSSLYVTTVTEPGTYDFFCSIHSSMRGTLTVTS